MNSRCVGPGGAQAMPNSETPRAARSAVQRAVTMKQQSSLGRSGRANACLPTAVCRCIACPQGFSTSDPKVFCASTAKGWYQLSGLHIVETAHRISCIASDLAQCGYQHARVRNDHSLGRASQLLYGRLDGLHRLIRKALMYRAFTRLSDIFPVGLLHGKSHRHLSATA